MIQRIRKLFRRAYYGFLLLFVFGWIWDSMYGYPGKSKDAPAPSTASMPALPQNQYYGVVPQLVGPRSYYPYTSSALPAPSPQSQLQQTLQDPGVQQGIVEGLGWLIDAYTNQEEPKPVYVRPYTKQDGTDVRAYYRSSPER